MATSVTTKLIAGGSWVQIKVMVDGILRAIGLATGCSYDEDWGVQGANVLNHLGPVSYDSQGYNLNINMSMFIPERPASLYQAADGGELTLSALLKTRDDVQQDGKGIAFAQLVFMNQATGEVLNQFEDVILASNGAQVSPNSYVTANARFQAVKRSI